MKTRLLLILVLLVAVAAAATAIIKLRAPTPTPPPSVPATPAHRQPEAAEPLDAVAAYLNALASDDFGMAYQYLSAESRAAHTYNEFAALCAERKGPSLDVGAARQHREDEDRVTVAVPMLDEPAEAGFTTVREQGSWRVVFVQGSPWFPYP
jgi:hypothetical protein